MATFQVQVEDLTGSISDTTAISSWLQDGCKEVINFIPRARLEDIASNSNFTDSTDIESMKVLSVLRRDASNSNYYMPCRKLSPAKMGMVHDSSNMEYATTSDPAYIVHNDVLNTFPQSAASNDSRVVYVNLDFSAVTYDDSSITNFPDEAEPAVVLYAARNGIQRLMNDLNLSVSDLSISATQPVPPTLSTVSYSDATNADASATAVSPITVGSVSDIDPTNSVPAYTKPTVGLSVVSIPDLSISSSAPSIPSIGTVSYSDASNQSGFAEDMSSVTFGTVPSQIDVSSNAPAYTKPTISLSSVAISDLSISASAPTAHDISSASVSFSASTPNFVPPTLSVDTTQFETFLETDEDAELAQLQLGRLNNEVQQYQANIQKEVATFNRDVQVYQAELQKSIKDAELTSASEAQQMQEYSNDIQLYAQNVNKEVQQYQANTQKELTLYQSRTGVELQQYSQDIQNELNEFNKENTLYQMEFQEAVTKFQADQQKVVEQARIDLAKAQQDAQNATNVDIANKAKDQELALQNAINNMQETINNNNSLLAKFQQELGLYAQNVAKEVQEYQQNTQKEITLYQSRTNVELQKYGQDIQNELNEFNKENVRYQAEMQDELAKHNTALQRAITQAQIDAADAQLESQQATSVALANKAADQALALQNSAQNMAAKIQDNNAIMSKYGVELQAYASNVSKEVQEYGNNLQKNSAKYTWYTQQYQIIAGQYKEFIQSLQGQITNK